MSISFGVCCANLTSLINQRIGWRQTCLLVGGINLVLTLMIVFLDEPRASKLYTRVSLVRKSEALFEVPLI
jgi:predicted MFS family arabinose efflux permease